MKKLLLFGILLFSIVNISAAITQIRWGSNAGPLNGLTLDWTSTGNSDKFRWGYTKAYEMGTFNTLKRPAISAGNSYFRYAFPIVNANSTIYYQIYDSAAKAWINQMTYKTAPPANTKTFSFIAQGDSRSNASTVWKNIADKVTLRTNNAFTLFTGDITGSGDNIAQYDDWFSNAVNYVGNNIIYHSQGNHDVPSSVSYYQKIFSLPSNNSENSNLYYSFKYGNALFISLNSEDVMSETSAQSVWLKSTLQQAKSDPTITWRIIFFHRPLVNAGEHYGEANARRANWGAWFDANDVDLILNGHDHNYQRSKPINFSNTGDVSVASSYGTSLGQGICQVICGGSGAGLYPQGSNADVPLTSIFYQGFNYVQIDVQDKILTANVYGLGSTVSATSPEILIEQVVIDKSKNLDSTQTAKNRQNPINVYPNPAQDMLTLKYSSAENGEGLIKIYDMSAREINSIKASKTTTDFEKKIDVSTLAKGIYTISVIIGGHQDSTIFIKK